MPLVVLMMLALQGDFDGDGRQDLVLRLGSDVAVLRAAGPALLLERDAELGFPQPDLVRVWPHSEPIEQSPFEERSPPQLRGDAIWIEKLESSSAIVFWNGKRFASYWQGD